MPPDADAVEGSLRVNIRPGARILSTLRHLNYRSWFALAEFVDNALQSFLDNRERINTVSATKQARVTVSIEIEATPPARIAIRDDAAGNRARGFRARVPAGGNSPGRKWPGRIRNGDEKRRLLVRSPLACAYQCAG